MSFFSNVTKLIAIIDWAVNQYERTVKYVKKFLARRKAEKIRRDVLSGGVDRVRKHVERIAKKRKNRANST